MENGTLTISVSMAGGAYPLAGAVVRIRGTEGAAGGIFYSLLTDRDGITPTVTLPAPDPSYSQNPESAEEGFTRFLVTVRAEGYYEKNIADVDIFPDVSARLVVNMIPNALKNPEDSEPLDERNAASYESISFSGGEDA